MLIPFAVFDGNVRWVNPQLVTCVDASPPQLADADKLKSVIYFDHNNWVAVADDPATVAAKISAGMR